MHHVLLTVLLLAAGCAWNKGELTKWPEGQATVTDGQLEKIGANAAEMEKFAVKDTPMPSEPLPLSPPPGPPKKTPAKVVTKPAPRPAAKPAPAPTVPKASPLPADYPPELIAADDKARAAWEAFRPSFVPNEALYLDVDYLGMTVGKVAMRYRGVKTMNGREVHHFQARFKSAPFYSAIYELDDTVETFVDKERFLGLRYNLVQRESKQNVDEVQLYDRETLRTTAYQKQVRGGKTKDRKWEAFIPRHSLDGFSVAYFIRGLPMRVGAQYAVPVVNKGKTLLLNLTVEAREKIRVKGRKGDVDTWRVHIMSKYTGTTLKSGDMMLWFADTPARELLRVKASIKIGSVFAEAAQGD